MDESLILSKERSANMAELLHTIRQWIVDDPKMALVEIDNLLEKVE